MPLYGLDYHLPLDDKFTINRDSPQAFGLAQWYPGAHAHAAGTVIPEYVSGFKKADMNGNRSFNNASHVSGPFGSAFPFAAPWIDGASSYITGLTYSGGSASGPQNGPQPFPIAPPFSVSLWIRPWGNYSGALWWMGRDGATTWYAHYLWYDNTNLLVSVYSVDNNVFRAASSSSGSTPKSKWSHICGVWHSTTDRRIYVNGRFYAQDTNTSNPDLSSGALIVAGAEKSQATYQSIWQGHLFDLRMYRRALSAPEVMSIYNPLTRFDLYKSARYSRPAAMPAGAATYTGTASVTIGAATASGSATHTAPIYTGTAAVTVGAATASGSATHTRPTYTGTASVSIGAVTASGSATRTTPTYTGSAAITIGAATCAGSATRTAPTYTGSSSVTVGAATASGTALFATAVYSGNAAVTVGHATASGSATFVAPVYAGTASVTVGAATASGSATHTAPTFNGLASVVVGAVTAAGSATFTSTTRTGAAAVSVGPATASGSATFVAPAYDTGTGYVNFADQYFFGGVL